MSLKNIHSNKYYVPSAIIGIVLTTSSVHGWGAVWHGTDWIVDSGTASAQKIAENFEYLKRKSEQASYWHTSFVGVTDGASLEMYSSIRESRAILFNDDGSVLYVLDDKHERIDEYTLTIPFNIKTASYAGEVLDISFFSDITDMTFNGDGTKLYILADSSYRSTGEYALSTPYDISTAGSYKKVDFIFGNRDVARNTREFLLSPDGTKLYLLSGPVSGTITQYDLATPHDITTATYVSSKVYGQTTLRSTTSLLFNQDGTQIYVLDSGPDSVAVFALTTPYDISTMNGKTTSQSVLGKSVIDFIFNNDGSKVYVLDAESDIVYEYTLSVPYDITTLDYANPAEVMSVGGRESETKDVLFTNDGMTMYALGAVGDQIKGYKLTKAYDISTAVFSRFFLWIYKQDYLPYDMMFNNDGTKLYMLGSAYDAVYEYTLSIQYDISSAVFAKKALSVVSGTPTAMLFNNTGTKLYIANSYRKRIYEYGLTVPYEVSSAVYTQKSLDVSDKLPSIQAMEFNKDGTILYTGGRSSTVHQYSLSTPYDILSADYVGIPQGLNESYQLNSLVFNSAGTTAYLVENQDILEKQLVSPYNLSSTYNILMDPKGVDSSGLADNNSGKDVGIDGNIEADSFCDPHTGECVSASEIRNFINSR